MIGNVNLNGFYFVKERNDKQTKAINNNKISDNNLIPLSKIPSDSIKARFLSFGVNNQLENNLKLAQESFKYVKNLNLFSTTKDIEENSFKESSFADDYSLSDFKHKLMGDRIFLDRQRKGKNIDDFVKITGKLAPCMHMGNCTENAVLAAKYLAENKKITNFALIAGFSEIEDSDKFHSNPLRYQNATATDHVFVVVGLDKNADLSNPSTWGKEAVIVDPWGDITAPVYKGGNINQEWVTEMKKLFETQNDLTFTNYAPFIDNTHDENSVYNWYNHRGVAR
ncbi:MAG TPA: hypothetical protein DDW90_02455 [Cyanobacteria bacterium UBA9971]|nr:hypothetical protein [Cyanobacteria bacterium UBA9971]